MLVTAIQTFKPLKNMQCLMRAGLARICFGFYCRILWLNFRYFHYVEFRDFSHLKLYVLIKSY
jgi:hypothetical protein